MKVIQVADGAFFVEPHFTQNVQSNIPGIINHTVGTVEMEFEGEPLGEIRELETIEDIATTQDQDLSKN